jgi:CubicO group peptidase (beta-lactamase class C family)
MTLVDEGKLDLDAPISTYLSWAAAPMGSGSGHFSARAELTDTKPRRQARTTRMAKYSGAVQGSSGQPTRSKLDRSR